MVYQAIRKATFLARPNRFIAHALLEGEQVVCHVKNTGRCRELLLPGVTVYLEESFNPRRKTKYDLVAVEKGPLLINMDAQAPNRVFEEWAKAGRFRPGLSMLQGEKSFGRSRFDFYWEGLEGRRGFVEVKGCTLEENGVACFPDAPTIRGVKHIKELVRAKEEGYEATLCFILQMEGMRYFRPNDKTHPAFGDALRWAARSGVEVFALDCRVAPDSLTPGGLIPVRL